MTRGCQGASNTIITVTRARQSVSIFLTHTLNDFRHKGQAPTPVSRASVLSYPQPFKQPRHIQPLSSAILSSFQKHTSYFLLSQRPPPLMTPRERLISHTPLSIAMPSPRFCSHVYLFFPSQQAHFVCGQAHWYQGMLNHSQPQVLNKNRTWAASRGDAPRKLAFSPFFSA